uniref:retron St85 family RNA-directed DNA polymerase n=1 Tax=Cellvibrio fontiphilus TaxID=1815559 RepID=UPI002B4BDBD4|nr:retron St85 family RNA-directed DNA polymerase [Cellvibrio fontiphilus]
MQLYSFLCTRLSLSKQEISLFALSAPKKYKIYSIPKRTSGTRVIAHPSKKLKNYQRVLVEHLEKILPVHSAALAYRKGLGIKDNAELHKNGRFLLKMDFQNFFPSITPELLFDVLSDLDLEFDKEDKYLLSRLLFCNMSKTDGGSLRLSIGAPSSPLISNVVMFRFDEHLSAECKRKGVRYTRYADDLTFSTNVNEVLFDIPSTVSAMLRGYLKGRIFINEAKTIFSSKAHNRHVTGITITNDGNISVGRKRKRCLSSMIHRFSLGMLPKDDMDYLRGLFSFVIDIEPQYKEKMITKYSLSIIDAIIRGDCNEK